MVKKWRYVWSFMLILLIGLGVYSNASDEGAASNERRALSIADAGWDSMQVHNYIAGFIIEHGYEYPVNMINGSSAATFTGLTMGEIDIYMELWYNNLEEPYEEALAKEEVVELTLNFTTGDQGFFVPTYVIEGDPEKGIEPMAPDLKTVEDLKKYPELFQDPQDPSKGVIIGGHSGSIAQEIMREKVNTYGLDEYYNYFSPGSAGATAASIVSAFMNHEPWVGYHWSPTWILTKYDMTKLVEPEFEETAWNENYGTAFPENQIYIVVHHELLEDAPDVAEFLSNYQTSNELTGEALLFMEESGANAEEAAVWFLQQNQDLWTDWLPDAVAEKVKAAL